VFVKEEESVQHIMFGERIHNTQEIELILWLTSDIFHWVATIETSHLHHGKQWYRAYEIWSHAEQILEQPCSEFPLVDAITTLKRAVDNRLRLLDNIYKFRRIPIREKPSGLLESMQYVGIIRPIMLEKLICIRNALEHEDAAPPDQDNCKAFLEFVWYFHRSTDLLVRQSINTFNLHPAESDLNLYSVGCAMGPENGWVPKIGGWVPSHLISEKANEHWILIKGEKYDSLSSFLARSPESNEVGVSPEDDTASRSGVTYFDGEVRGPAESLKALLQLYFKVI